MKKKLMIALPSLEGGGAERVMLTLANNIDKKKFDVFFLVVDAEGAYKKLISEDVILIDLKTKRVRHSIKKIISAVNEVKPDILMSTLSYLSIVILAIKSRFKYNPKIIIRLSNTPSQILKEYSSQKQILIKCLVNHFYSKADIIIAQCKEMKVDLHNTFDINDEKVTYIYNPVDIEYIKKSITSENPYDLKSINLLAVGRLTYQKGFDILLKSFSKVLEEYPNAKLTILGQGELKEDLNDLVTDLGISKNVDMVGFVDNPYNYYYYTDLFVLSSRWEGFPNALLEALACKSKVVSTNCQSGPTEILMDNKYGDLAEVNNYRDLAVQIIKSIESENKNNNRAEDFNVSKILKEYESLFMSI